MPAIVGWAPSLARRLASAAALLAFVLMAAPGLTRGPSMSFAIRSAPAEAMPDTTAPSSGADATRTAELMIGAYSGLPYTHPSDLNVTRPDGSTFTVREIDWQTKPWTDPIYYGVRVSGWAGRAPFGAMLDFTHSKAIAALENEEAFEGAKDGTPLAPKSKLGQIFERLEFSHGHNILTLNGLYRLPFGSARVQPYVGLGLGVNLPHTEVWIEGDEKRTYEYQLAGPATQALAGLEIRMPRSMSIFLEYKFSFSWYQAPLTGRDGGWLFEDIWRQLSERQAGTQPVNGTVETHLATHQVIGGLAVRIAGKPGLVP
jgi:hypothetical protein